MENMIRTVLNWAIGLAMVGGLVDATKLMMIEAAKANQQGLISLI